MPSPLSWRRDGLRCLALVLAAFVLFNANLRAITAVDTYAARYLPLSILHNKTLTLDPIVTEVAQGRDESLRVLQAPQNAFWIRKGASDRFVSLYPLATPLAVLPLYIPAALYLDATGWDPQRVDWVARIMEKLSASLIAAATVGLVYLLLRRRAEPGTAVLLAAAFAFGTTTWVISSQALWMHGLGALLVTATLLLLTGRSTPARSFAAGFFCALIVANRQPDAVLALGLGLYALWWARRHALFVLLGGIIPAGLLLFYNLHYVGNLFGAYALTSPDTRRTFLQGNPVEGVLGLLFSPTRGLFVFSPFLLVLLLYPRRVFQDRGARALSIVGAAALILQVVGYGFGDWRQGTSWGPRWLTDMLPILIWMLPPVVAGLARGPRIAFAIACLASIAIQAVGAFWYVGASDVALYADAGPHRTRAAWRVENAPFIAELTHPPAPRDLLVPVRGSMDAVRVVAQGPDGSGLQLEVEGWALAGSRSPAHVAIRVDGRDVGGTGTFLDRSDVVAALGEASPSGWRVVIPADRIAPGEHTVAALVLVQPQGDLRLLDQARFTLDRNAAELAGAARRAAQSIAAGQQAAGYWLTDYTTGTVFDPAGTEMNTYTQALLVDVAAPIAAEAGLAEALERARGFLSSQIEASGLVRYHGLPDSPTIGVLGCAITPDADDTALAWRIAPGPRRDLLASALATLERYRRGDGLYRTWLAPRERYECIDPGRDPNPADIGIQINVLLFLAQADPPASRALCEALRPRLDDDDLWVYYRQAPAIVAYRQRDLENLGCPLDFPTTRLRSDIAGQDQWLKAVTLLHVLESHAGSDAALAESLVLLQSLAGSDFFLLRRDPPLIYHNDLTATVRRFYWSRDVGFALWLRLYSAALKAQGEACTSPGPCGT